MVQPIVFSSPVATAWLCCPPSAITNSNIKTNPPPPPDTLKIISLFRNAQRNNTMGIRENLSFSCKNRSDYDKSYQEIFCTQRPLLQGVWPAFVSGSLICVAPGSHLYYYSPPCLLSPPVPCLFKPTNICTNTDNNTGLQREWECCDISNIDLTECNNINQSAALNFYKSFISKNVKTNYLKIKIKDNY